MKAWWKMSVAAAFVSISGVAADAYAQDVALERASFEYFQESEAPTPVPQAMAGEYDAIDPMMSYDAPCKGCDTGCSSCCEESWLPGIFSRCCATGEPFRLFGTGNSAINIGGWTQVGYHNRSTNMFNNRPDNLNLHQQYAFIEKLADGSDGCWDWGFRTDIMYGIDAQDTQAFGNPPQANASRWDNGWDHGAYGWALPQAYLEAARGDFSVRAGHFYTILGYEAVTAPDNFFYSRSFTMVNSEPRTHTGALTSYRLNKSTEIYAGWTLGWDTGFDQFGGGNNFIGGFGHNITDRVKLTYVNTAGDMGRRGEGYTHSVVLDSQIGDRLNYVIQSDLVSLNANNPTGNLNDTIGVNQYLLYHWSDCLAFGSRVEWWKADGGSLWAATTGMNIRPHANVVIRPEVRYDWGNTATANNFGFLNDTWTCGIDAILTY